MSQLAAHCHPAWLLPVSAWCRQALPSSLTVLQGTVNHLTLAIAAFSLGFATIPTSLLFWSPFHHSALARLQPGHFPSLVWGSRLLLHQSFHQTLLSCLHSPSSSSANLSGIFIAPVSTHSATSAHSSSRYNHFLPTSSETPLF